MLETLLWIMQKVNTFPKKQRFVLGQQIENSSLVCLRCIVEANEMRDESECLLCLEKLNIELMILRDLLRVAYEMGFMNADSLSYVIGEINEVGKMRGGWFKKILSRQKV